VVVTWTLSHLLAKSPHGFEVLVKNLWVDMGYEVLREPLGGRPDGGMDVHIRSRTQPEKTICLQAKRHQPGNTVGVAKIREYAGLHRLEDVDTVIVVTTSSFSKPAREEAPKLKVTLIDGEELLRMLNASRLPAPPSHQHLVPLDKAQQASSTAEEERSVAVDWPAVETKRNDLGWGSGLLILGGIGILAGLAAEIPVLFAMSILPVVVGWLMLKESLGIADKPRKSRKRRRGRSVWGPSRPIWHSRRRKWF